MRRFVLEALVLIAILLSITCVSAYSQPRQDKSKNAGDAYNISRDNQRGTRENPLVVEAHGAEPSDAKAKQEQAEKDEHAHAESLISVGTVALAVITGILALATIVLAVFTYKLWTETKALREAATTDSENQRKDTLESLRISRESAHAATETVKTMQDTAQRQLRAYIGINAAYLEDVIAPGKPVTVTVEVKNFGLTPAYEITGSVHLVQIPIGQHDAELPYDLDPELINVLHGGSSLFKSRIKPSISEEEVARMKSGETAFYLFGQYTYQVAFDMPRRTTQFCYILHRIADKIGMDFGLNDYGNKAD